MSSKACLVTIHKAKTNLSGLLSKVAEGEEVIIAKGAQPVAKLVAIGVVKGKRRPGSLKDSLVTGPEFFEPLPSDELTGWE